MFEKVWDPEKKILITSKRGHSALRENALHTQLYWVFVFYSKLNRFLLLDRVCVCKALDVFSF